MFARPQHRLRDRGHVRLRWKVLVGGAALALAAAASVVAQGAEASAPCDPQRPVLQVVASPDIAAAVSRIARGVHDAGGCPAVHVRAEAAPDVLTALRQSTAPPPDVWIPDSSLWVARAVDEQLVLPVDQVSIAASPLTLAVPAGLRDRLAHGEAAVPWPDVVTALNAGQLVLHVPAEVASPSTVGILGALTAAVQQQPDPRTTLTRLLRTVRVDSGLVDGTGALAALDADADRAVPVPEQVVFEHRGTPDATDIAAIYPSTEGTPFDYPFTTLRAGGILEATAGRLLTALASRQGQQVLRDDGFRGIDGSGDGLTANRGVDGTQPGTVRVPDLATATDLLETFDAMRRDARLLGVVDVSGSMAEPVPGAGGSTRLDLALRAAAAGLQLYPDTTEVGLWSFSEDVTGAPDHQELVPIAPITDSGPGGREAIAVAMAHLRPVPDGGTGLYDTALAAVRAVRADWDPARVNAVILLTDGADTDAQGIGLDELLSTLHSEQASGQPVPVITIAYGDDNGAEALAAISAATDGAAYQTSDPGRILDIFLDAVGQRACRPQCEPWAGN
jgi:Mg-chelatase subunit ChlD